VSDEEKPHVFEKFYRGRAAASAPGGSGLGLAIAAEIARSHGGRIHVTDAEGGGAVFSLTLPAAEEDVQ
jgi:signal transduction histidine kinase